MTEQFDNTNTIVLFANDKEGNEKRPDYTGKVNVDGVEKSVSVWIGETKTGKPMLKGQVSEPYVPKEAVQAQPVADSANPPF